MDRFRRVNFHRKRVFPYYLGIGLALGCSRIRESRRKVRSTEWYDRTVLNDFRDEDWYENFRMKRENFFKICAKLENALAPAPKTVEEPLDVTKKVAIAIYWLASSAEYRTIANLFGVAKSTVYECVHQVCEAIMEHLLEEYVCFPEGDRLKKVIKGYEERWGFPNCGGAIDGTHIPIIAPKHSHGDYLNRKGFYSLILQGVCDHSYVFTDINIGWPGRVHDARVFANSEIYLKGDNDSLFPEWRKPVGENTMPVVLLGDPAYPLKTWLLKPYTNRSTLTNTQFNFNHRLSRARMTIENSFGRLKGRWRCLQKRLDVEVEFACTVIGACVVLHNFCESEKEDYIWDTYSDDTDDEDDDTQDGDVEVIRCAKALRDDIAAAFANNNL